MSRRLWLLHWLGLAILAAKPGAARAALPPGPPDDLAGAARKATSGCKILNRLYGRPRSEVTLYFDAEADANAFFDAACRLLAQKRPVTPGGG